jgi:hypothetical protein
MLSHQQAFRGYCSGLTVAHGQMACVVVLHWSQQEKRQIIFLLLWRQRSTEYCAPSQLNARHFDIDHVDICQLFDTP